MTTVDCDTVVFTGDFVPDHELARRGGVALDPGTRGPAVDGAFRTGADGVFAVGNVLHAVEPALWAAREGALAADAVRGFLDGSGPARGGPAIEVAAPLRWVAPNRAVPQVPVDAFVLRTSQALTRPVLVVTQDGRRLHRQYVPRRALPNRTLHLAGRWTRSVDATGGPVRITVGGPRGGILGAATE